MSSLSNSQSSYLHRCGIPYGCGLIIHFIGRLMSLTKYDAIVSPSLQKIQSPPGRMPLKYNTIQEAFTQNFSCTLARYQVLWHNTCSFFNSVVDHPFECKKISFCCYSACLSFPILVIAHFFADDNQVTLLAFWLHSLFDTTFGIRSR